MIRVERTNLFHRIQTMQSSQREALSKKYNEAIRLPADAQNKALEALKGEVDALPKTRNVSGKKARIEDTK